MMFNVPTPEQSTGKPAATQPQGACASFLYWGELRPPQTPPTRGFHPLTQEREYKQP